MTEAENIEKLKLKYLEYYADLPVQKYAAMYVGRDEDTILAWKKKDSEFSDKIQELRAQWVKKKVSKAKVEFALERLEREVFKDTKEVVLVNPIEEILKKFGVGDAEQADSTTQGTSKKPT